jgi:hypothetical protein
MTTEKVDPIGAAKAMDQLISTVNNHAVGEYFLQQAEKEPTEDQYPLVVLCPASAQLKAYGPFGELEEAESWLDNEHYGGSDFAYSGQFCNDGEVDYDMHGIVWVEAPHG